MNRAEIEDKVREFLIEDLEVEEDVIAPEAKLKDDLGIDSLDFVDIVVIVEKKFGFKIKPEEMAGALATLIYYPKEKMDRIKKTEKNMEDWYKITLYRLIEVCKRNASKYTRSKVRKALRTDFAYVIEELITEKKDMTDKESYSYPFIQRVATS